jgi:hypothetical protein
MSKRKRRDALRAAVLSHREDATVIDRRYSEEIPRAGARSADGDIGGDPRCARKRQAKNG